MKMKIQLSEALCGFKKTIKTLDDRVLVITSKSGTVSALLLCWVGAASRGLAPLPFLPSSKSLLTTGEFYDKCLNILRGKKNSESGGRASNRNLGVEHHNLNCKILVW